MKEYGVILADPPWQFSNTGVNGTAEKHYSTMSVQDIKALPVKDVSKKDCVLLLWACWPLLLEGLAVLQEWGFRYKTGFPWIKTMSVTKTLSGELFIKPKCGIGFWVRGCSEVLLIGVKGKVSPPEPSKRFVGLLGPSIYHSCKLENLYDLAETMKGPFLEMFARRRRPGWDVFGNHFSSGICLDKKEKIQPPSPSKGQLESCRGRASREEVPPDLSLF